MYFSGQSFFDLEYNDRHPYLFHLSKMFGPNCTHLEIDFSPNKFQYALGNFQQYFKRFTQLQSAELKSLTLSQLQNFVSIQKSNSNLKKVELIDMNDSKFCVVWNLMQLESVTCSADILNFREDIFNPNITSLKVLDTKNKNVDDSRFFFHLFRFFPNLKNLDLSEFKMCFYNITRGELVNQIWLCNDADNLAEMMEIAKVFMPNLRHMKLSLLGNQELDFDGLDQIDEMTILSDYITFNFYEEQIRSALPQLKKINFVWK